VYLSIYIGTSTRAEVERRANSRAHTA
jgi:hypothetical protein